MSREFAHKNLQKVSFKNEDLKHARFVDADLRGADFTGTDLTCADFNHVRTGIAPQNLLWLFLAALAVSILSGVFAMLTGRTIQIMLASEDSKIRTAGIISGIMLSVFIFYAWWKGGGNAIRQLIIPASLLALFVAAVAYVSGLGTGKGMLYLALSYFFLVIMFIVGTVARAVAGTLSNIIFLVVALAGGMFGKSIGGGVAAVIMAMSCAVISKKALSGAKGFDFLRSIAFNITSKFGTSFRNSRMTEAHFSNSKVQNADFTNADISLVNWEGSRKINCLVDQKILTEKKIRPKNTT